MSQLPIELVIPELLSKLKVNQQLILKAPTGAGKSTFLPLELIKQKWLTGKIIMLEPRRLAARNIAKYLAKQLDQPVGESIGYRVRGETKVSSNTKLEIVTEGIMTRLIQSDPELTGIDLIIFDEFHERSIHADTSLAFGLEIQEAFREDLKILLMSATLDQNALKSLLPDADYVESHGRSFPVEHVYSPLKSNERIADAIARKIKQILDIEPGSILVFLPGIAAIKQVQKQLTDLPNEVDVFALYGQLSFVDQQMAISPCVSGRRKVVLATNIAETSLTIDGIRVVIDSGLERTAKFDLKSGITRLEEGRIAQSSAEQRAGRAGRIEEGVCVRMYSKEQLSLQAKVADAEILYSDLSSLCLELSQWGTEPEQLRWMDIPPTSAIEQGYALLNQLALVTTEKHLTEKGKQVSALGVDARFGSMLIQAKQHSESMLNCALCLAVLIEEVRLKQVDITFAVYQIKSNRFEKQGMVEQRIRSLASKLRFSFIREKIDETLIGLCLAMAYPDRIGQKRTNQTGQFILANGHGGFIPVSEPLSDSNYVVAVDLMRSNQNSSQIFVAAPLDIKQLEKELPHLINQVESVDWDEAKGRLVAESQCCVGKIIISRQLLPEPNKEKITQALVSYVQRKGIQCLNWEDKSRALLERYRCGAEWFPEKEWPDLSNEGLSENINEWLAPFMTNVTSVKALQKISLIPAINAYLGWPLNQEVDALLPTHYLLPTGTNKKIIYQSGKEPMLSVRMQEMFGEHQSPMIANGQKTIVLELLSPAQRPLQITSDLAGFWNGSYRDVQKEMKGRYPKHVWPDDPANHLATTKTKRQLNS